MTQATEDQIFTLFKQLPADRQTEVLDELQNLIDDDGDDSLLVPAEDYLKDE